MEGEWTEGSEVKPDEDREEAEGETEAGEHGGSGGRTWDRMPPVYTICIRRARGRLRAGGSGELPGVWFGRLTRHDWMGRVVAPKRPVRDAAPTEDGRGRRYAGDAFSHFGAMCSVFGGLCSVSGPMCSLSGRMCSLLRVKCSVFGGARLRARPPSAGSGQVSEDAGMTGMCPLCQANVSSSEPDVSSL